MVLWGTVPESFRHSHFSVVAALVPSAQQMAKRSHPFTDEASKYTGASSKSRPENIRVLTLAAVRHDKQETTQSDVKGQVNPSQGIGRPLACPRFNREARSHGSGSVRCGR